MARSKKRGSASDGAPVWMATFADMMSLLLTFFILLLSFAEMDIIKFKDAMGSINQALGFMPSNTGLFNKDSSPIDHQNPVSTPKPEILAHSSNDKIMEELEQLISEKGLEEDVDVEDSSRGVILKVQGKMFFNRGTAELKPESHEVLNRVAGLLNKYPNNVSIEGHTDNVPIRGGRYASNWELSTARAISALKYFQEFSDADIKKIHIAGFGSTHPVASNDTSEGRAKNRRVEFVFYNNSNEPE